MASQGPGAGPTAPMSNDLPPPYSAVVGNPQYGFVVPPTEAFPGGQGVPKAYTPQGVYPHPPTVMQPIQGESGGPPPQPPPGVAMGVPVGIVVPQSVGSEPTTVTCFNCGRVVTTRVNYTTAWHTHLVAGSVCVITMVCSLCCLGLVPYCFDTFKDAEHYCPNCNTFIGKSNKC